MPPFGRRSNANPHTHINAHINKVCDGISVSCPQPFVHIPPVTLEKALLEDIKKTD